MKLNLKPKSKTKTSKRVLKKKTKFKSVSKMEIILKSGFEKTKSNFRNEFEK